MLLNGVLSFQATSLSDYCLALSLSLSLVIVRLPSPSAFLSLTFVSWTKVDARAAETVCVFKVVVPLSSLSPIETLCGPLEKVFFFVKGSVNNPYVDFKVSLLGSGVRGCVFLEVSLCSPSPLHCTLRWICGHTRMTQTSRLCTSTTQR